jgi:uncharacterized membrane protein YbhN (UPF0104 family)
VKVSPRALKFAGALVSVISIASVVLWASNQKAPDWPSSAANLTLVGLAALGYLAACALRAERWHLLLRFNGADASRADCYALTAVGFMGNNVLPARGGDVLRTVLLTPRVRDMDARGVVGTLVAERVLDVVVLLALFLVVAFGLLHGVDLPEGGRFEFAAIAVGVLVLLVALGVVVAHRRGVLARIVAWAQPLAVATRNLHGRHGAEAVAVTASIWGSEILVWFMVGHATGLDVSLLQTCYMLSVASVFVLVPSGPGYAGTFDAAVIFAAKALNRANSVAIGFLLLLRFVMFIPITLAGLILLIVRYGGLRTARSAV